MRVLVCTTAGTGHFGPLVPVARACATAGHEVRVAAPESFASHVVRAGFDHAPFDDVPKEVLGPIFASLGALSNEEANERVIREVFAGHDATHALPGLTRTIGQWRPDLVLREPCEFGSLAAAVALGIPHVEVAIGMGEILEWAGPPLREPLAALAATAGVPADRLWQSMERAPRATTVPESLDGPPPDGRVVHRYRDDGLDDVGPSLPGDWGDPDRPLVYATFGSVAGAFEDFAPVYRGTLDALADSPVRLLLTTGHAFDASALDPVPANALVRQWWPQEQVMPLAAAMVGHGGFGTTMSGLVAGVPQVVVPLFASDQFRNAESVVAVGAGVALEGGPAATERLADAVATVLADDRYARGARAVAAQVAALPGVTEVVAQLTRHALAAT